MKGSVFPSAYRRVGAGVAVLVLSFVAACSSDGADTAGGEGDENQAKVEISPKDGSSDISPDEPVTVKATKGSITDVQVEQSGGDDSGEGPAVKDKDDGALNKKKTEWTSDWNLSPGSDVSVTATAKSDEGEETEVVSEFSTKGATDGRKLELQSNFPQSGETVGVGMPVIVNFDLPVKNKEQVENSMEISSKESAQGAWNWFNGDKMAVFRPEKYWKPDTKVTVDLNLAGVKAAKGVYGVKNHSMSFKVGRKQTSTINAKSHRMKVERDGEEIKDFPVSVGRADQRKYTTTSGTHLTMEKHENYTMDSSTTGVDVDSAEGYKLDVKYAIRFSNSGEFTHAAPWNNSLGEANLSHGCPNMSNSDAKWFFENTYKGDPLEVTGTDRDLEVDNGWGFWQRSWKDWLDKSATGKPDKTNEPGTPGSTHTKK